MPMSEKIRIIMIKRNNMPLKELADKIGDTPQNLSNKLKRDNFNEKDLIKIAAALNCDFKSGFVLKDTQEEV